jgi:hypothetical protein
MSASEWEPSGGMCESAALSRSTSVLSPSSPASELMPPVLLVVMPPMPVPVLVLVLVPVLVSVDGMPPEPPLPELVVVAVCTLLEQEAGARAAAAPRNALTDALHASERVVPGPRPALPEPGLPGPRPGLMDEAMVSLSLG